MKGYKVVRQLSDGRLVSAMLSQRSRFCLEYGVGRNTFPADGFCMVFGDSGAAVRFVTALWALRVAVYECDYDPAPEPVFGSLIWVAATDSDSAMAEFWRAVREGDEYGVMRFSEQFVQYGTVFASRVRLVGRVEKW